MLQFVQYPPWSLLDRWHRELEHAFPGPTSGSEPAIGAAWAPAVDVQEESTGFRVRADIPGVAAKDIDVTAEDGVLTIRGERKANAPVPGNGFESTERATGAFMRRFTLPDEAHTAGVTANYADGVLEIVIPKAPRAATTRIAVTVN